MVVRIVRTEQTCYACPSQWDAWDAEGRYYYLRYRSAHGTVHRYDSPDYERWPYAQAPTIEFVNLYADPLDGCISLEDFCELAGIELDPNGDYR